MKDHLGKSLIITIFSALIVFLFFFPYAIFIYTSSYSPNISVRVDALLYLKSCFFSTLLIFLATFLTIIIRDKFEGDTILDGFFLGFANLIYIFFRSEIFFAIEFRRAIDGFFGKLNFFYYNTVFTDFSAYFKTFFNALPGFCSHWFLVELFLLFLLTHLWLFLLDYHKKFTIYFFFFIFCFTAIAVNVVPDIKNSYKLFKQKRIVEELKALKRPIRVPTIYTIKNGQLFEAIKTTTGKIMEMKKNAGMTGLGLYVVLTDAERVNFVFIQAGVDSTQKGALFVHGKKLLADSAGEDAILGILQNRSIWKEKIMRYLAKRTLLRRKENPDKR
ncbi:hypothetical protein ACFL35_08620 [Candidatus Riflebacteria bacterium]